MTRYFFQPGQVWKDRHGYIRAVIKVDKKRVYYTHKDTLYQSGYWHPIGIALDLSRKSELIGELPVILTLRQTRKLKQLKCNSISQKT